MGPFIGLIAIFPYGWAPQGWALCEGQILRIEHHQALFTLLGTKFGGDGQSTFALPNMKKQADELGDNLTYAIALQGLFPQHT
ncbi:phage tail protein [Nocardia salmonicida]|uniref:phage tail protein n=1 Tax=Nocardia salmonicida TaxID=53431 RepID=UPI0037BD81FA